MTKLPQRLTLTQTQQQWASIIDPVLANPINNARILKDISLVSGANVVNHLLGQALQGWIVTRKSAATDIYDTQNTNQTPALTLNLNSSNPAVVSIMVF